MQPVLKSQLEKIGLKIETRVTDEVMGTLQSGDFDLLLLSQHTAPAGDPAFFLNFYFAPKGGDNFWGFDDARMNAILDAFTRTADTIGRIKLAQDAQSLISETLPVIFIATPVWHVGLSHKLAAYEPWGSDYYVIRPDFIANK
jgi:peptide/nickel transport system substrate-binding protein